jgi:hypothetical protein
MADAFTPTIAQQRAMADYLIGAVVGEATGEADGDRCVGEPPSARYYLGALAPADLDLSASGARRGRQTAPSAGFEFEVTDPKAELSVAATVSCYYRVFPTLDEQLDFHGGEDDPVDRVGREYRLAPAFKRVEVGIGPLAVNLDPARPLADVGAAEFAAVFDEARAAAASDPNVDRRQGDDRRERFVPGEALASEDAFSAWLGRLPGNALVPEWRALVSVMTRPVASGRVRVTVLLVNAGEDPTVTRRVRGEDVLRHDDARDHFLFRVRIEVTAKPGVVLPIEMNLGPDAYRYEPRLPAYATNCGVGYRSDSGGVHLWSVPAPVHETRRAPANEHPSTAFEVLATDPLPALDRVVSDMHAYASSPVWGSQALPPELAARKLLDREAFELEVGRFAEGVRWLRRDPRLLLAFRLTNRTMIRLGELTGRPYPGWRLFQLVFMVSQLPALAWREHDPGDFTRGLWGDKTDADPTAAATVLWYPTAGGKTEAYHGLEACAMFYDRARGKLRGVTAWCRFPLRLLSLQQTQRVLDLVVAADEVRKEAAVELRRAGGAEGDRFALGFYAGEGNTPNSLSRDQAVLQRLVTDPRRRREVRVAETCPYCRQRRVEVLPPDPSSLRLVHACDSCGRELPLHVVDTEVYRYLPALVVGTLDKLAMIGLSDRFGSLLGDVDCECVLHGLGRGGKCHERRARGHPDNLVVPLARPLYDASPSLEIVDELHMVDEELGAFSGHYETMLALVQRQLSARTRADGREVRMKVVATTATIKGEDRQCEHLFGLRSVVVPLPGPSLEGSFYWRREEAPGRRFVGVLPQRATAEMALVRILTAAHSAVRRLEAEGPALVDGLTGISGPDFDALLDLYRVSLTYVTSLVDFGKLRRSMDTQVNEVLRRRGLREVRTRQLSGDTRFDEVRDTLEDLASSGPTEAVVATSMVSHGVDVDRLNLMVFNGMPKSMAEYIQASSRVGRRYLGVVFMIFNPVRERDRSHFRYHGKFHEYLDRMVEPVPINRWSRYAAQRTLPGVLMAEILQSVNREYWAAGRAPGHLHDLVRMKEALRLPDSGGLPGAQPEALLDALGLAYELDRDEAVELRPEIADALHAAISNIRAAGAASGAAVGTRIRYRGTGDHLGLGHDPMTSLRDVAQGLPFYVLQDRRRP